MKDNNSILPDKVNKKITVKFYLYNRYEIIDNEKSLYVRIIINRRKSEFSMNRAVNENLWDGINGMFLPKSNQTKYWNNQLIGLRVELENIYHKLLMINRSVTPAMVKDAYLGIIKTSPVTVSDFFDSFIGEAEAKTGEYCSGTISHFRTTKKHFLNYLKDNSFKMADITKANIVKFENYLLSTPHPILKRPMNRNTANKYLTKLKTIFLNALNKEIITHNPFFGFKLKGVRVNKVALTDAEIKTIYENDFGGNESLKKVRVIFIFSIYTGLRYSDALGLRAEYVSQDKEGIYWIDGNQIKTKEPLDIPMINKAVDVYKKYALLRKSTGFVLPQISNQKINSFLKIIAEIAGIKKKLTHHVGRHTFATQLLENGIDFKTVSRWLGHTSLKSTEVYAQITKKRLRNAAIELAELKKQ